MTERKRPPTGAEMPTAHRYTTEELGRLFLGENFQGDASLFENSQRRIGINLQFTLGKMFPGRTEYSKSDRAEIIGLMAKGELDFGYMAYMLQEGHPVVKNWPEAEKRKSLRYILAKKISAFKNHLSEIKSGKPIRYVDLSTTESIEKEMAPYQQFKNRLSQRK